MTEINTLVADPAWKYGDGLRKMKRSGRGAESHYPCISLPEIAGILPQALGESQCTVAPNAHLWMWITNGFLVNEDWQQVPRAWGFVPKTICTWVKLTIHKGPELWRPHPALPVCVSTHGRVKLGARLLNWTGGGDYPRVTFTVEGRQHKPCVHILVAETFLGPRPDKYDIDHLDGNKDEPCLNNLEYVTRRENHRRAAEYGLLGVEQKPFEQLSHVQKWRRSTMQVGLGRYLRNVTEHLIFCTRGSLTPNVRNVPTAFFAPRTTHSTKPTEAYRLIERVSPGPYLELFARAPRPGWTVWGNQVA